MADQTLNEGTQLLEEHRGGNLVAAEQFFQIAYDEIKQIAKALIDKERPGHTFQATALVHEAWLRLRTCLPDKNRAYFFAAVRNAMRQALVDHARGRAARPDRLQRVPLDAVVDQLEESHQAKFEVLAEPLEQLSRIHPRQHAVVMLRSKKHTFQEIATRLGVSLGTVAGDWRFARAWLLTRLGSEQ